MNRPRVHQIVTGDPTFPAPVATLASGRIWPVDDIERWIAEHRPDLR